MNWTAAEGKDDYGQSKVGILTPMRRQLRRVAGDSSGPPWLSPPPPPGPAAAAQRLSG